MILTSLVQRHKNAPEAGRPVKNIHHIDMELLALKTYSHLNSLGKLKVAEFISVRKKSSLTSSHMLIPFPPGAFVKGWSVVTQR